MDERPSSTSSTLSQHYELCEIIEKGPFSTIHRAIHRTSGCVCAVKTIDLRRYSHISKLSRKDVEVEIRVCSSLKHPHLCQLRDVISTGASRVHLVFDYLDGMDICFEIVKRVNAGFVYSEAVASHYMKQLLKALVYLHERGVIHRDIRPHSAMLVTKDNSAPIKITNFGVAIAIEQGETCVLPGCVGISEFMAPEVASKHAYGVHADMWSTGVLLYILLCGRPPFRGSKITVYETVLKGRFPLSGWLWRDVSDCAKDLVAKMLTVDPMRRITAIEAMDHSWIKDRSHKAPRHHLQGTVDELRRYNCRRKSKNTVLATVNSSKWTQCQSLDVHSESAYSFVTGDSLSGGDTCGADGCTRMGPLQLTDETRGVDQILLSLDQMAFLTDRSTNDSDQSSHILTSLNDPQLQQLLELYDTISNFPPLKKPPEQDALHWSRNLSEQLDRISHASTQVVELRLLLASVQLQAVLQAHDVLAHEVFGADQGVYRSETPPAAVSTFLANGSPGDTLAGSSSTHPESGSVSCGDDDSLMQVTRIRLVQFQKHSKEPMGITLKVTEDGKCLVARIMHGGMIHRQGTMHVGDEIREINNISVANQSIDSLQNLLSDVDGSVTFKIVPSFRSAPPTCEIFVRAQFDYDPQQDDLIPCSRAGVPFKTGDILQVISKDDHNWWQARFMASFPALTTGGHSTIQKKIAGLIPSPELQEWRTACLAMEKTNENSHCTWLTRKKKHYTTRYLQKHSALFDQLELVTYEEVVRLSTFRRRTLVLLGAHGVGRRHIKNTLIQRHSDRFAYPIPHELDGRHYHFVGHETMLADIQMNEYLEYGTHEDYMYGTKLTTIKAIHRQGKMAILDVEPQALKMLRTPEYSPFVAFVAAPNLQGLQDPDGSLQRLLQESELLRQAYGHYFDFVIVNNDIDETIGRLELVVEKLHACPQWVPVSWVY